MIENSKYRDVYYDHFTGNEFSNAPKFSTNKNYMMRFAAPLKNYVFENNNLTIIFFKEGIGNLNLKDGRTKIGKNKFIVTNPSSGWEYTNEKEEYIDVLSLVISGGLKSQFDFYNFAGEKELLDSPFDKNHLDSYFLESPLNADYYLSGKLLKYIYELSETIEFKLSSPEELSMEVLSTIYADQNKAYSLANKIKAKKKSTRLETFKRLMIAYEYINDNLTNSISLQELSLESSLSKYHLFESFKTVFGKSPHQYINRLKVAKSKEYLEKGYYSVGEVSEMFGFTDLPVFSKVFKKIYKNPPSHYQKTRITSCLSD